MGKLPRGAPKRGGVPKKVKGQGKIGKKAARVMSSTVQGAGVLYERAVKKRPDQNPAKRKKGPMTRKQQSAAKEQLYPEGKRLLLVGEGDFSFTAALLRLRGHGGGVVSTCLDSRAQLLKKYPGSKQYLDECDAQGAVVVTDVDATKLQECEAVAGSASEIDNIIFNFPHTGCGIKDKSRNVALHQRLMYDFFMSAKQLVSGEGEIHVALKKGEPYDSWRIAAMAKDAGLVVKTSFPFSPDMFPGYAHCKTSGVPGLHGDNSLINKYGARIWVITHPWDRYKKTFSEAPRFRHDLDDESSVEDHVGEA